MHSLIRAVSVLVFMVFCRTSTAAAADITVLDPLGNVKATATTEGVNPITVRFELGEGQSLEGKRIELRNKADGTVVAGTVTGNAIVFENVSAGSWELLADPELITVASVEIGADPALAGAAAGGTIFQNSVAMGVLGGGVLAGGAATAITLGVRDNKSHPMSPAS